MEPVVRPLITVAEVGDKKVLGAEIPPADFSSRQVYYRPKGRLKGTYVRIGDSDEPMTETEAYAYEAFRDNISGDMKIGKGPLLYPDTELLKTYINQYREGHLNTKNVLSDEGILKFSGIYKEKKLLFTLPEKPRSPIQKFIAVPFKTNGCSIEE